MNPFSEIHSAGYPEAAKALACAVVSAHSNCESEVWAAVRAFNRFLGPEHNLPGFLQGRHFRAFHVDYHCTELTKLDALKDLADEFLETV